MGGGNESRNVPQDYRQVARRNVGVCCHQRRGTLSQCFGETKLDDPKPLVAEFSFKYADDKENYSGKMARRAYDSFMGIQDRLGAWVDNKSMTKTAYVYALEH